MEIIEKWAIMGAMVFAVLLQIRELTDLEPFLIFALIANSMQCIALLTAIILLVLQHRATRRQIGALQVLVTRGIGPEQLVKLASALDRLPESDVEDLLASRVRPSEAGSSTGSSSDRR